MSCAWESWGEKIDILEREAARTDVSQGKGGGNKSYGVHWQEEILCLARHFLRGRHGSAGDRDLSNDPK